MSRPDSLSRRAPSGSFTVRVVVGLCSAVFFFLTAQVGLAAVFTVTNTNDDGPGSLRQAISSANTNLQADTINFDAVVFSTPQTILLTSGELRILRDLSLPSGNVFNLTIVGPGRDLLTIDANHQSRVFFSDDGNYAFALRGLTITRGFSTLGGAIYARNSIDISNVAVTDSVAAGAENTNGFLAGMGGGIYAESLVMTDSEVSGNLATGIVVPNPNPGNGNGDGGSAGVGGGLFIRAGASQIINCFFTNNAARGKDSSATGGTGVQGGFANGGAIYSGFGISIINSTFSNNSAIAGNGGSGTAGGKGGGAQGGAVDINGSRILNVLVYGNFVRGGNGGISTFSPTLSGNGGDAKGGGVFEAGNGRMANVTLYGNNATAGTGRIAGNGQGGGLYIGNNQWNIVNLTITTNSSVGGIGTETNGLGQGGGAYSAFQSVPPTPNFRNNIVAENTAASGTDVFGFFAGASNNLIRIADGSTGMSNGVSGNIAGTSLSPVDPLLGSLDDNGGLTQTRALLEGSPAINAGNNSVFNPVTSQTLTFDQRNYQRIAPVGGTIDMGAYEFGAVAAPTPTAAPDLQNGSDTGVSTTDNVTRSTAPVFDIAGVIAGATVDLLRDDVVVASVTAVTFSVSLSDPNAPLNGSALYIARQTFGTQTSVASPGLTVTFDHIAPTGVINQAATQIDPTQSLPIVYTAVFSEPVGGYAISFTGSTANVSSASPFTENVGGGITWRTEVFGIVSNGQFVVANILAGAYQDIAGNPGLASTSTDNQITVDNVRPSVTINQAVGQQDPAFAQPLNFTVTFGEPVTGFNSTDISFTGSTANMSQANVSVAGGPTIYSVSISNIGSAGLVRASIPANAAQDALGNVSLASVSSDNSITLLSRRSAFDFDGDGKTDIGIFRPSGGEWWVNRSGDGQTFALQFGSSTDKIVPADYTGDGKVDVAIFRPSSGEWYVLRSEDFSFFALPFGTNGDAPAPGDYDADGKADFAVFRPSSSTWFISQSGGAPTRIVQFGTTGDAPVVSDYDGDGKADIGIFRQAASGAEWWIDRSTGGPLAMQFGESTDKAVQGDYTGDGKSDIAIWRPSTGEWFIVRSEDFSFYGFPFGTTGDVVAPGDYDGDGKFDATVFRPSSATWFISRTTAGTQIVQFGATGDRPLPNAFVP